MFLYSAISSPWDGSKLFLPWQTRSFRHQLDFSGKHSSHAAIRRPTHEDNSLTSSLNWGVVGRTKMPKLRNDSKGNSNPGSIDCGLDRLRYKKTDLNRLVP